MPLKPGENPRFVLPGHQERGEVVFSYTLKQIAEAANVKYQTVRKAVFENRLDPGEAKAGIANTAQLRSVAQYIIRALTHKSQCVGEEELMGTLGIATAARWSRRWPRFELYRCSTPGCLELLLFPGACAAHGGDKRPPIKFDPNDHISILVGKDYVSLGRIIAQTPEGQHTHHRDGNVWNNRFDNLESLTPEEHANRHVGGVLSATIAFGQPPRKPFRSELGGMTRARLQTMLDAAYLRGLEEGKARRGNE